jgi:Tol biopolymer transport system component
MKACQSIPAAAVLVLAWATFAHAQQTAEELYQAGLYQEEVQGNLESAIETYERIVLDFPGNRPAAARALMHIGLCHEKLGSREAQSAYERLVRDYADQTDLVDRARTRLTALRRPVEATEASTITTRQVWAGPISSGIDMSGGPTPNGRQLAYVDWRTCGVAIRDIETGDSRPLVAGDTCRTAYPTSLRVGPGGESLAYLWIIQDSVVELRRVGTDGTNPRVLYSNPDWETWDPAWSTDGRHVAVTLLGAQRRTTDVAWVSTEDGSMRRLNDFPARFDQLSSSPDDRFLAAEFRVEEDSLRRDIALLATDGSGSMPLIDHPADDRLLGWLPGTDHVLFRSDRSGSWDLWAVRVEDGEAQGLPRAVRRAVGDVGAMGFTRDGSLFYSVYTLRYTTSIVPFDQETGRIRMEASEPLFGPSSNNRPAWSPTGDRLAFVRRVPAPPGRGYRGYSERQEVLYVRDLATGKEQPLATDLVPATVGTPAWFPDGRSILLIGMKLEDSVTEDWGDVPSALYRVDLETGEATQLLEFPPHPNWWFGKAAVATADGEGMIYLHDGRLVRRHLASGREAELYAHPGLASRTLALSPDGEQLVFGIADSAADEGRPRVQLNRGDRLMVMPARGGEARELFRLDVAARVSFTTWTSDGRYVVFLQRDEDSTAVVRVPAMGGEPERVFATQQELAGLSLSPDGQRAAYYTQENEAEIWVMENLVATLSDKQ